MYLASQEQFTTAPLLDRLIGVLGGLDMGNGTPVAEALATAFEIDLRMSEGGSEGAARLLALSRDEIVDKACELMWVYGEYAAEIVLPLGTRVIGTGTGEVSFGREVWVSDVGRTGLHPMETTRRDAHGRNLDLLHSHIQRLTRKLACRRIGLPKPIFIVDTDDRHLLVFPPFAEAGGVVLQRWANGTNAPRFCAARPDQVLELAKSIVADMRVLWKRRKEIGARAQAVFNYAQESAAEHGSSVRMVAIDLHFHRPEDTSFAMYVLYDGIDEAMRPGPVLDYHNWHDQLDPTWRRVPYGVDGRRSELDRLRALGADGRIDNMAEALAKVAPQGLTAVLAELASNYEATFEVPTRGTPMYVTLFWRDGVIKAEVTMTGKLDYCRTQLDIHSLMLPETVIDSLLGRRVTEFAKLPFDCECKVLAVDCRASKVSLELDVGCRLVDLAAGRIWDEPADVD